MKDLTALDEFRQRDRSVLEMYGSFGDEGNGVFRLLCQRTGTYLLCIASNGDGWDHVSVSVAHRIPNWLEMHFAKRTFFADGQTAMQLHVPLSRSRQRPSLLPAPVAAQRRPRNASPARDLRRPCHKAVISQPPVREALIDQRRHPP